MKVYIAPNGINSKRICMQTDHLLFCFSLSLSLSHTHTHTYTHTHTHTHTRLVILVVILVLWLKESVDKQVTTLYYPCFLQMTIPPPGPKETSMHSSTPLSSLKTTVILAFSLTQ